MHPLLADRRRWQILVAAWAVAGLTLGLLVRLVLGLDWLDAVCFGVPLGLAATPGSLSAWYICRTMPLARTPVARLVGTAVSAAAVTATVWAGVGWIWWRVLAGSGLMNGDPPATLLPLLIGVGSLAYLLALTVTYLIETFEASADAGQRVLEAQVAHRDAELAALRAQIDPHFLFNSLNSIVGLITGDPEQARMMCQMLGDFLRDSLTLGNADRIALGREVALAEQYLGVEQVRFGTRLRVVTSIAPDAADVQVPPLILQPLVENAVRHGVATRLEGGAVEISARRSGTRAVVAVLNPRDEDATRPGTGLGLTIVRRRLAAAFGDRAALVLEPAAGSYIATVIVPTDDGPAHG